MWVIALFLMRESTAILRSERGSMAKKRLRTITLESMYLEGSIRFLQKLISGRIKGRLLTQFLLSLYY